VSGPRDLLLDVSRMIWRGSTRRLPTGIDRVCIAYARHYAGRALAVVQRGSLRRVLGAKASRRMFALIDAPPPDFRRRVAAILAASLTEPAARTTRPLYLNVGHTGLDSPELFAWLRRIEAQPVCLVHDLIPITHPEFCRPGEDAKHRARMANMLRGGSAVIANSRATLKELAAFAGDEGLGVGPHLVAPLGYPVAAKAPAPIATDRPYFVILGTIEARKNHLLLMNVWRELAGRMGAALPRLVIIGQRGWECEQVIDLLERCDALAGHVLELPNASDAALAACLAGARALLFPSFVEGYGIPLIEALALGTPVIASDLPVFRELAGDIPDYLSPIDGLGWAAAIADYAQGESKARAAQLGRMQGYAAPGWDGHFALVDAWLETL
jgi:glycosyltransferase involved in cell wall biosynthesis